MSSLRIRALKIVVRTEKGEFGRFLEFPDGLVVVHGDNSHGKSTCMQAIIYGLGLEGMFGPSQKPPFPQAMTDRLFMDTGTVNAVPVSASAVFLEVENERGERLTTLRTVKGQESTHTIRVARGALLTAPSDLEFQRTYVRQGGAVEGQYGFHRILAEFIGWSLPDVAKVSGEMIPLYMECIFPLLYVEQKEGWAAPQGRFPGYFGIRETGKRAVEFLLGLDVFELGRKRAVLAERLNELKVAWSSRNLELRRLATGLGVQIEGVPPAPHAGWSADAVRMFVQRGNVWLSLGQERERLREELAALEQVDVPTVGASLAEAEAELKVQEARLREIEAATEDAHRLLAVEQASLQAAQARTAALEEDLSKYREIAKLRRLGSDMDGRDLLGDECPTCHQSVPDSLTLGNAPGSVFMSVDENIRLLDSQLKMFALLAQDAEAKVALQEQQIDQGRVNASACRSAIRSLRRTLTADERAPSEAAIARRLALEDRIVRIEAFEAGVAESIVEFVSLAKGWAEAEVELESLPRGLVSELDQRKVEALEGSFVSQAATYGVTSVRPSGLSIARDSYRPTYEGFDLKFDLSASDGIRVTWAYLNAFMEIAREFRTNHPGLLIFDDPRQQNAKPESLAELFGRVAICGKFAQQMIVATSEKEEPLLAMLQDLPHTLHRLDGRSLQQLPKK